MFRAQEIPPGKRAMTVETSRSSKSEIPQAAESAGRRYGLLAMTDEPCAENAQPGLTA